MAREIQKSSKKQKASKAKEKAEKGRGAGVLIHNFSIRAGPIFKVVKVPEQPKSSISLAIRTRPVSVPVITKPLLPSIDPMDFDFQFGSDKFMPSLAQAIAIGKALRLGENGIIIYGPTIGKRAGKFFKQDKPSTTIGRSQSRYQAVRRLRLSVKAIVQSAHEVGSVLESGTREQKVSAISELLSGHKGFRYRRLTLLKEFQYATAERMVKRYLAKSLLGPEVQAASQDRKTLEDTWYVPARYAREGGVGQAVSGGLPAYYDKNTPRD